MLQESTSSLASCQGIARAIVSEPTIQHGPADATFQYFWLNGETWLVLGEIEQEQRQLAASWSAYSNAKTSLDAVDKFAKAMALPLAARFDDLTKRVREGLRDTKVSRNSPG